MAKAKRKTKKSTAAKTKVKVKKTKARTTSKKATRKPAKKAARKPAKKVSLKLSKNSKPYTKSQTAACLSDITEGTVTKKDASTIIDSMKDIIVSHLQGPGTFTIPGVCKFKLKRKPATKARKGINPFTGEPTIFKAKPARNVVKILPLKGLKDEV